MRRAVRSQVNSRARARPRSRSARASAGSPSSRSIAPRDRRAPSGDRTAAPRRRRPPAARRPSAQATGTPRCHRLQHRQPEPLVERGKDERVGERPQALELLPREPPLEAHVGGTPSAAARARSSRLVPRGVAGQHQQRPALGGDARERADQREQVLVRALGGESQQHPPLAEREARAGRPAPRARARGDGAEPQRHDVDPLAAGRRAAR